MSLTSRLIAFCILIPFNCFSGILCIPAEPGLTTTHGKEFLLPGFFKDNDRYRYGYRYSTNIRIFITSKTSGNCSINGKEVILNGDDVTEMSLPLQTSGSVLISVHSGVYLNCSETVSVYVSSEHDNGAESFAYTALPTRSLSNTYMIPGLNYQNPLLGVVSGKDNTHVNIVLKSQCTFEYNNFYYQSGETISVVLNKLDTLQLGQNTKCDFGGTVVQGDHPIAVFSGSFKPVPMSYRDSPNSPPVVFQLPPITAFSKQVIVPTPSFAKRSNIRILAEENDTNVKLHAVNGGAISTYDITLQHGQIKDLEFDVGVHSVITSSNPILVVQLAEYSDRFNGQFVYGPLSHYPDIEMYEDNYTVFPMNSSIHNSHPILTVVSQTKSKMFVHINGSYPAAMKWDDLPQTGFSIGRMSVNMSTYHIEAKDPVMVRFDGYVNNNPYGYIGGYSQQSPTSNFTNHEGAKGNTVELHCLSDGWLVTVDLSTLPTRPSDVSSIYMGQDRCTGKLHGDILTFNVSYDQCGTAFQVDTDRMRYENRIVYKTATQIQWDQLLQCTSSSHKVDTVRFGKSSQNLKTLSSEIYGDLVGTTLYADRSFQKPMVYPVSITPGTDVFVKVSTPVAASVFVVNQCEMMIETSGVKKGSIVIMQDGCAVSNGSAVLLTRNEMTLFKFVMFDLGVDQNSAYITCDVTFCDKMDYSSRCDQRCHNYPNPILIG